MTLYKLLFARKTIKPYMTDQEILVIENLLKTMQPVRCLEWGAGYSTIYFSQLLPPGAEWIAVEHDYRWHQTMSALLQAAPLMHRSIPHGWEGVFIRVQLSRAGLQTINRLVRLFRTSPYANLPVHLFYVAPDRAVFTDAYQEGTWDDLKGYIEFPARLGRFDFILIDGRARKECLIKAHEIVKDEGVVVLHDAARKYYHGSFELYPYQKLLADHLVDDPDAPAGGLWIGSKSNIIPGSS